LPFPPFFVRTLPDPHIAVEGVAEGLREGLFLGQALEQIGFALCQPDGYFDIAGITGLWAARGTMGHGSIPFVLTVWLLSGDNRV
jgi:hypothetical protein